MKKKNHKPMVYSKKNRSRELKGRSLYVSLIIVAIVAVGLVYGYQALTRPPETETAAAAFSPESKLAFSAEETTAKQEAQPEQEKATPVQTAVQTKSSVKATVRPTKPSAKSRIETPVSPEYARKLIEDLKRIPPEDTRDIRRTLRELEQQGDLALPAIQEFLDSEEAEYATDATEPDSEIMADYRSMQLMLLDALVQIGSEVALDIMAQRLQSTSDPEQIALLAKGMETHAPGIYQDEILTAARNSLAQVSESTSESKDAIGKNIVALATVFSTYGDDSVVVDLENIYPQWKTLSMMALAEIPEEKGIASLTRIVEDPVTTPSDRNFAWRMLAQASRESPEASKMIVDAAYTNQITSYDFIRIASALGGRELRLNDQSSKSMVSKGTESANLVVTRSILNAPSKWSDVEIDQRLDLIDRLFETKPEPAVVDALLNAQASLLEWGDIPYIDGVRKR